MNTAVINAKLTMESAIRQAQPKEGKLGETVDGINQKVDAINQHIDKALDDAPTQSKVTIKVNDDDWQKI